MVFSSVEFLCIFLPAVLLGYYILPKRARNIWLLLASLAFYTCGGPQHLIYLISSIVINFIFGIVLDRPSGNEKGKKVLCAIAVIANIGALVYFKYTGMILDTIASITKREASIPEIILPIGISFYTFQCISYVVDVYRGEKATRNIIHFALFVAMFPQLLQGPIIRYSEVKDALVSPVITVDSFVKGIERFITGLAKKAIIANTIGEVCDQIFEIAPANMSVSVAWLGAIMYTLQIYFDFAGYTDMAIGLGKMFGFTFRENFNYPYISKSVTEFWRRWHMSLSNWFRDYLYIPLGGNRRGNVYINLLIVFLATGIWHGAAWGFVVWGLWHGLFMLIERALRQKSLPLPAFISNIFKWGYTILVVTLGWVLFKIEDLPEALSYIGAMFGIVKSGYTAFSTSFFLDVRMAFFLVIAIIACVPWAQVLPRYASTYVAKFCDSEDNVPRISRHVCLILLLVISFMFIVNTTYSPFIYFQF